MTFAEITPYLVVGLGIWTIGAILLLILEGK